ncbi:hypothetical protein BDV25DRAFT_154060 [Aspergillus avenaceus]|uniref:Uncharacterized protein n=1 Tax=Aspergillus avenaceus TaxID=36643 RepID=A0A5N6TW25_ASPAV|nr:hypothetical protein BDV25DRAFT_154060 [Aspergillus avenaceus]
MPIKLLPNSPQITNTPEWQARYTKLTDQCTKNRSQFHPLPWNGQPVPQITTPKQRGHSYIQVLERLPLITREYDPSILDDWPPPNTRLNDTLLGYAFLHKSIGERAEKWPYDFDRCGNVRTTRNPSGSPFIVSANGYRWIAVIRGFYVLIGGLIGAVHPWVIARYPGGGPGHKLMAGLVLCPPGLAHLPARDIGNRVDWAPVTASYQALAYPVIHMPDFVLLGISPEPEQSGSEQDGSEVASSETGSVTDEARPKRECDGDQDAAEDGLFTALPSWPDVYDLRHTKYRFERNHSLSVAVDQAQYRHAQADATLRFSPPRAKMPRPSLEVSPGLWSPPAGSVHVPSQSESPTQVALRLFN